MSCFDNRHRGDRIVKAFAGLNRNGCDKIMADKTDSVLIFDTVPAVRTDSGSDKPRTVRRDCDEFGLFVFTKEDLDIDQIKQTIAFMMEKQAYQNRLYSRLFLSQIQTLFDCDLETGRYRKINISEEQRRSFYEEAIKV